ncbi:MAG TPA: Ig-like domain-containing protein, partial [Sedimentisphaerales bacterium]|nr:Ig-like domain-containing protein [Sedimentisphaerales bacterium]
GHAVTCVQPGANANALFRIFSGDGTQILGQFDATGNIFLIDPAGILFGANSQVNVNRLVASSLDISNQDFLDGRYEFFAGADNIGTIVNNGTINSAGGVALIGKKILNTGTIMTSEGGFVVMAAGDRVLLGESGSNVIVEMDSVTLTDPENPEGFGDVLNEGEITAPGGTVALAAGDVFATALELPKVSGGIGRIEQNGLIHTDGTTGDGGSVSLTSGDEVVLGSTSQTTANAGTNGDGGQVIVYSPGSAIFEDGARVEAKGGSESGNGGFFELSGKEYVEVVGDIDLTAANGKSGMFLIDPLDLWIVDSDTANGDVTEDPEGTWKPTNDASVSELDIDILEDYLGLANVTLSTVGTVGNEEGNIIFDADRYVHTAVGVDNSLFVKAAGNIEFTENDGIKFEGNGHVELYAGPKGSVTTDDRGNNPSNPNIWTIKGDIIIEAGSGGIDVGVLRTGAPNTRPGEIRLQTIKEDEGVAADGKYDITTEHLRVEGKGYGSVYVNSDGDLTINGSQSAGGAVHVKTNAVANNEDALSFICLTAEKNVTINSAGGDKGILALAQGKRDSIASIWIGAGTDEYAGTATINADLHAKASAPGSEFAKSIASIKVFGSDIFIVTGGGIQEPHAEGVNVDVETSTISTTPFIDENNAVYDEDGELIQGSLALVWIDETQNGTCLNCGNVQRKILPVAIPDWLTASKNIMVYAVVVLDNDMEDQSSLLDGTVLLADNPFTKGTLTLINGDTEVEYEPPTDWVFDENGEFTDYFEYYAVDSDGEVSEIPAVVTIKLINQTPVANPDFYDVGPETTLIAPVHQGTIVGLLPAYADFDPDNKIPDRLFDDQLTAVLVNSGTTTMGGTVTLNADGSFSYTPPADFSGPDSFSYFVTDGYGNSEPVQVTINVGSMPPAPPAPAVPYIQPAPGLQIEVVEISGCPALTKWVASELGTDESKIQIWMANALASNRGIPPCDACADLKEAATILQDVDGTRVAALAQVISQFASSTAPPTEEQMASIAYAIANDIEGNVQYAAAGEYLDALAKYVGILNSEMGFTADESVQFATDNYVQKLVEGEEMGVAAYVAARLTALGGSE